MDLHQIIISSSYLGIFILLITNGAVNIPSSQIIYLIAGYFIATGKLSMFPTLFFGTLGNTIGNIITYLLVYKYGRPIVKKLLTVPEKTLDHMHYEFSNKGLWWLFVAKLIPSVKVTVPTIAGLSKTPKTKTYLIFLSSSFVWATTITYIGYYFGENITAKGYALTMGIVGIIMFAFAYFKFIKTKN